MEKRINRTLLKHSEIRSIYHKLFTYARIQNIQTCI